MLPTPDGKYRTYSRVDIDELPPIPARLTHSLTRPR